MLRILVEKWWVLALRGAIAVVFGIAVFVRPDVTLTALVLMFGLYALAGGVFTAVAAYVTRERRSNWLVLLIEGIVIAAIGIATLVWPDITALTLLYLIAVQAIFSGVFQIFAAYRLRHQIEDEWTVAMSGMLALVFGVLVVLSPGDGALAILTLLAFYAIVSGLAQLIVGLRLRSLRDKIDVIEQQFAPIIEAYHDEVRGTA